MIYYNIFMTYDLDSWYIVMIYYHIGSLGMLLLFIIT